MQYAVILPGFLVGMAIAFGRRDVLAAGFVNWGVALVAFIALVPLYFLPSMIVDFDEKSPVANAIILGERLCYALIAWYIVKNLYHRVSQGFLDYEKYVFFIFCSHFILFAAINAVLYRFISRADPLTYIFTFIDPFLGVVFGIAGYRILRALSPAVLGLLTGGRVK